MNDRGVVAQLTIAVSAGSGVTYEQLEADHLRLVGWNGFGTQRWQPTATGSGPNSAETPVNAVSGD